MNRMSAACPAGLLLLRPASLDALRAAAAGLRSTRAFHDGIISGGHSPLHGHPLGHVPPPASMSGGYGSYHATTILSVRKGGKVVRARRPWRRGEEGRAAAPVDV